MNAYDYQAQKWVEGEAARAVLVRQLEAEIAILNGPRAESFVRASNPLGSGVTVAEAKAVATSRLAELTPQTTLPCGCVHHGILAGCPVHGQQATHAPKTIQEHNAFPEGRWT